MKNKMSLDMASIKDTILYFLFFPFPLFQCIDYRIGTVFDFLMVLGILLNIITKLNKKIKFGKYEIILLLFLTYTMIICICTNMYALSTYLRHYILSIGATWALVYIMFQGNYHTTCKYILKVYEFAIWCNAIIMMIFPKGIVKSAFGAAEERAVWIFGSKNNVVLYAIFIIFFISINTYWNGFSKIDIGSFFIMLIFFVSTGSNKFEFMSGSSTMLIVFFIYLVLLIVLNIRQSRVLEKMFSIRAIVVESFVTMWIVWNIIINKNGYLSIFLSLLGKNGTLSGRLYAWMKAYSLYKNNKIFGIGDVDVIYPISKYIFVNNTNPYSFWINIIVRYGWIGIGLVMAIFFVVPKNHFIFEKKLGHIFAITIFLLMVCGISNTIGWKYFIFILSFWVMLNRTYPFGVYRYK